MRPRRLATTLGLTVISAFAVAACAASGSSAPATAGSGTATARPNPSNGHPSQDAAAMNPKALDPQNVGTAHLARVPGTTASAGPSPTSPPSSVSYGTGIAAVPAAGQPVSTAHPDHVIGAGSPAGCTSSAVVAAVAAGGVITFSCGPHPVTIVMTATAKVRNTSTEVVLDGGGKVTLSGAGARRILYQDTCDPAQTWSTSHCQDQATPHLVVQNLTLANGNSTGQTYDGGGGGAIFDRGGRLRIVNSTFTGNGAGGVWHAITGSTLTAAAGMSSPSATKSSSGMSGSGSGSGAGYGSGTKVSASSPRPIVKHPVAQATTPAAAARPAPPSTSPASAPSPTSSVIGGNCGEGACW